MNNKIKSRKLYGGKISDNKYYGIDDSLYSWRYNQIALYSLYKSDVACELEYLIDHPVLFEKYKGIGQVKVWFFDGEENKAEVVLPKTLDIVNNFDKCEIRITLNFKYYAENGKEFKTIDSNEPDLARESILLHEIQHILQAIHNRPTGISRLDAYKEGTARINTLRANKKAERLTHQEQIELDFYDSFNQDELNDYFYYTNEGELEARKVVRIWLKGKGIRYVDPLTEELGIPVYDDEIKPSDSNDTNFSSGGGIENNSKFMKRPTAKYRQGQVLDLKGYGKVKILDLAWLTPPMTVRPQYIYDFILNHEGKITKFKRNDFSLYEYEVDMMLADVDTGIDYEKSYEKYLGSGLRATGNPPLDYTRFIKVINSSLYYKNHPEFELNPPVKNFYEAYAVTKFSEGGLIAPNGKKSNLTEQQYKLVRTPEFKAWFGDWENDPVNASKVVDENGEPMPVYHGTYKEFYVFGEGQRLRNVEHIKNTNYFHKSKKYAEKFGFEKPYFLNIKKIVLIEQPIMEKLGYVKDIYDQYVLKGIDGVYSEDGEYATLFSANQIKLADGSNTTFDGSNPDIRFGSGGAITPKEKEDLMKFAIKKYGEKRVNKALGILYKWTRGDKFKFNIEDFEPLSVFKPKELPEKLYKGIQDNSIKRWDEVEDWGNYIEGFKNKMVGKLSSWSKSVSVASQFATGNQIFTWNNPKKDEIFIDVSLIPIKYRFSGEVGGSSNLFAVSHNINVPTNEQEIIMLIKQSSLSRIKNHEVHYGDSSVDTLGLTKYPVRIRYNNGGGVGHTIINRKNNSDIVPIFVTDTEVFEGGSFHDMFGTVKKVNEIISEAKLPIKAVRRLGTGQYGIAYLTSKNTVLKITNNEREAFADFLIRRNQDKVKSQVKIFNIFKITDGSLSYFFIEKEYVPKTADEFQDESEYKGIIQQLYAQGYYIADNFDSDSVLLKKANKFYDDYIYKIEGSSKSEKEINHLKKNKKEAIEIIVAYIKFWRDIEDDKSNPNIDIEINDVHKGNYGFKDGKFLCFDCISSGEKHFKLGGSVTKTKNTTMKKPRSNKLTAKEVKEKSEMISEKINEIKKQLRWHEGKEVAYPLTDKEKQIINDGLGEIRKERERIWAIYLDMKDNKKATISSDKANIKLFDVYISYAVRLLDAKYIINYLRLNKKNRIDGKFYSTMDIQYEERRIKEFSSKLGEETGDYTDYINLMKIITNEREERFSTPQVLLQYSDEPSNLVITELSDYLGGAVTKYDGAKVVYSTAPFELPKVKTEIDVEIEPIAKQAIKELITVKKYSRLTEEEGEYLYAKFKDYEGLIDEYGEYVAKVQEPIIDAKKEEFSEFMEMLGQKQYIYYSSYDETIEAYQITIDFINSVRGRIATIEAKQSGTDLFPETDLLVDIEGKTSSELKEALDYLNDELKNDPNNQEIKDAIEYIESEVGTRYQEGGELKYYEVQKDGRPVLKAKFGKVEDKNIPYTSKMLDGLADKGYSLKELTEEQYRKFDYSKVNSDDISEFMKGLEHFNKGGKIEFDKNKVPSVRIYNYAIKLKKQHPKIWMLGGNQFGNQAFKNLEKVIKRGYWLESEKWMFIKWRGYVARHQADFRIEGVIAMLKWIDTVDKGWEYMKEVIEEEISKLNKFDGGGFIIDKGEEGACYKNVFDYVFKDDNIWDKAIIVQGKVTKGSGYTIHHAWIIVDDNVIDPTTGVSVSKEKYYNQLNAKESHRYSFYDYMKMKNKTKVFDYWNQEQVEKILGK